jgi:ribonuclease HI
MTKEENIRRDIIKIDERFYSQTEPWQRRFLELRQESPQKDWNWIVGHYQGDQDDLDHLINKFVRIDE